MQRHKVIGTALCGGVLALWVSNADAEEFSARLVGFNETPLAILSEATGTFQLDLDRKHHQATYTLTYSAGLSSPVTQAHIHFGKNHVSGGIIVWLCGTTTNPGPSGTPTCPAPGVPVTGMITAANVQVLANQNVTAGDFDAFQDALDSNTAYSNVHTKNFPGGEIRGQVHRGDLTEKKDDHEHK